MDLGLEKFRLKMKVCIVSCDGPCAIASIDILNFKSILISNRELERPVSFERTCTVASNGSVMICGSL